MEKVKPRNRLQGRDRRGCPHTRMDRTQSTTVRKSIRSDFSGLWGLGAPVARESWGSTGLAYQWGLREMTLKLRNR